MMPSLPLAGAMLVREFCELGDFEVAADFPRAGMALLWSEVETLIFSYRPEICKMPTCVPGGRN